MEVILKSSSNIPLPDIIINEFPFLIGRDEMPFAMLEHDSEDMREALSFLSEHHAIIFEQGDGVFIVDPGSMNGTKLNGNNLGIWPVMLQDGDLINFRFNV